MIKLVLFTTLLHGGYIETSTTVSECNAEELNIRIQATNEHFYYCEAEDE